MTTTAEARWLEYAWRVATSSPEHKGACLRKGGAAPAPGYEGNELRWPGYLGRDFREGHGVLCVGAVHGTNWDEGDDTQARLTLESSLWTWLESGRSDEADRIYLASVRDVYEWWMPQWRRWQPFAKVIDKLGDSVRDVAWTNLAKCRASRDASTLRLTTFCQREYPIADVIEAIRPIAAVTCTKRSNEGGGIVTTWKTAHAEPLVFTFDGMRGTDLASRKIGVWSEDAAALIHQRRTIVTAASTSAEDHIGVALGELTAIKGRS